MSTRSSLVYIEYLREKGSLHIYFQFRRGLRGLYCTIWNPKKDRLYFIKTWEPYWVVYKNSTGQQLG